MAAQMKLWEAEGVPQKEVVVRVAAWLCSDDEDEAELEAEMVRAEQRLMDERRARGQR